MSNGEALSYDTLVLATGAMHGYFGHPEWARFAPGLKTLDDARRIRAQILMAFEKAEMQRDATERARLMTFAIVGGGPTGVEMAGAIAGSPRQALASDFRNIDPTEARILLIEAAPGVLGSFPEDLSAYAEKALARLGVTLLTGKPVEEVTEGGVRVGSEFIPTSTIIWAAGVAASPPGRWLGVATDPAGRVSVAPDLSVPRLENVYVLGDLALAKDERQAPSGLGPGCTPAGTLSRQVAGRSHHSPRKPSAISLPQPGQSGSGRPERRRRALGSLEAQRLRRLASLGSGARLFACRLPQSLPRDHALALDLLHLPAWRALDRRRPCGCEAGRRSRHIRPVDRVPDQRAGA